MADFDERKDATNLAVFSERKTQPKNGGLDEGDTIKKRNGGLDNKDTTKMQRLVGSYFSG